MTAAAQHAASAEAAAPRVGRPARVSAQAIIDAAIEIGLDGVTLKQVADKLGVAVATLYRHVRNRDELMRLAAFRVALARRLPADTGRSAHWSDVVTGFAESVYESFVREPQLLFEMAKGRLGPEVEVDFLEQFLAALEPHGFSPAEGIRLHHSIALLAIGAAAATAGVKASRETGTPMEATVRRALLERAPDELPHVRAALGEYLNIDPTGWLLALRALLAGVAAARGEQLPVTETTRSIR